MTRPSATHTIMHVNVRAFSNAERAYLPSQRRQTTLDARAIVAQIPPHPEYDLYYGGGHTIPQLTFTTRYIGGSAKWQNQDVANIDRAIAAAMSDQRLNNVMQQYFSQPITSAFRPSAILNGTAPSEITQASAEQMLTQLYQQGQLSGFDYPATVFGLICPSGTILTDNGSVTSLQGLGGYHGAVSVGGTTLYYAIVVYAENQANGQQNGIVAFDQPWKNITAAMYHELNEARTDADVNGTPGWISNPIADFNGQQVEVGDAPVFEAGNNLALVFQEITLADGSGTAPVQFMYSNAVHGPEGPRDTADAPTSLAVPGTGGGINVGMILVVLVILALAVGAYFVFFHH